MIVVTPVFLLMLALVMNWLFKTSMLPFSLAAKEKLALLLMFTMSLLVMRMSSRVKSFSTMLTDPILLVIAKSPSKDEPVTVIA